MTRLLLLVALGIVAALYFPESRAVVLDAATPVLTPLRRWQTQHEMDEIAREIRTHERENYGQLPPARGFANWLVGRLGQDAGLDSWGGEYALLLERDSFVIVSWGPDGLPRNGDDIRASFVRSRPGR